MALTAIYPWLLQLEYSRTTLIVSAGSSVVLVFIRAIYLLIWRPYKLQTLYRRQNIKGPPFRPLIGNSVDVAKFERIVTKTKRTARSDVCVHIFPQLSSWSQIYGPVFTYMEGTVLKLCILDTNLLRELLARKVDCYRKCWRPGESSWRGIFASFRRTLDLDLDVDQSKFAELLGHCEPHRHSTVRRILLPGSDHDGRAVQMTLKNTMDHCKALVLKWGVLVDEISDKGITTVEIDATREIAKTSLIIVLTNLIGSTLSNSDVESIQSVWDTKKNHFETNKSSSHLFTGHLGHSRSNKDGLVQRLVKETIRSRLQLSSRPNRPRDLLDLMASIYRRSTMKEDEQRLFADCSMMVAAQKATTLLINQTLFLLAGHIHWQTQARAEVLEIKPLISAATLDNDEAAVNALKSKLAKLKILNMILNESLRLAPPIKVIDKICDKQHRLGKYTVLPGTVVQMPIVLFHHSPELWGEDCSSFRPDRFESTHDLSSGRTKPRQNPFSLLPFSAGPSGCLGFNFALQEAKILLASIVSNFTFRLPSAFTSVKHPELGSGSFKLLEIWSSGEQFPPLSIKRLTMEDFAEAAKERLRRTRSNFF